MTISIQLSKLFKLTTKNANNTSVALVPKRGGGGGGALVAHRRSF